MSYWLQSLDQNGPTASSQRVTQISKCPVSVKPKHCTHATCINDYTFPLLFSWMILYLCFFKRNFKYWLPRGQCSAVPPRVQQHLCILLMFFFSFGVLSFKLDLWLRQQTVVTDTGFHKCSGAHSVISTTVPSPFQYSIVCVYCIQIYREKDTHTYKSTNT